MRDDDAILLVPAQSGVEIADPRQQFRAGFAARGREGQRRRRPAVEIGAPDRLPRLAFPSAEIELLQTPVDR